MIKSETRIFSCNVGGNGLSTITKEINDYLENKESVELSYHNITTDGQGYVIATVKAVAETTEGGTKTEIQT